MNIQELLKESSREYLQGIIEDLRKNEKPFGRLRTLEKQVMEAARKSSGVQEYNGAKWILSPWTGKCEDSSQITFRIHDAYELPEAEPEFFFGEFEYTGRDVYYKAPWDKQLYFVLILPCEAPLHGWVLKGYSETKDKGAEHQCKSLPTRGGNSSIKYYNYAVFRRIK